LPFKIGPAVSGRDLGSWGSCLKFQLEVAQCQCYAAVHTALVSCAEPQKSTASEVGH
jgi:hypothetical protein